jgi:threonine dehydrogenase-like Zn-dependent dehydrogenase
MQWDARARGTTRAVDEDGGAHDLRAGAPYGVERVLYGAAGRHDVVDDENALAGSELEPAPELPAPTALDAFGVDRSQLHLSRDLVREDDAAGRRSGDGPRRERARPLRDVLAEGGGAHRPLEHLELLEVARRVVSRREDEVSLAEGTGFAEYTLDLARCDHRATVSRPDCPYAPCVRALTVVPGRAGSGAVRVVPDPAPADGEVLVDVVRVGLCGTDAEIERGEYGRAPDGADVLVIGHESFGRVARDAGPFKAGTPVVASVRRPDGCPNCHSGEQDMCLWGGFRERGVKSIHGFCAEQFAERPEYLFAVPEAIAEVAVLLEPLTITEKGWRHLVVAQKRMTVWEPRTALVAGGGPVGILAATKLRLQGLDVTVVERQHKPEKEALLARIGAGYAATSVTPLATIAERSKRIDVVIEATGNSAVAFECLRLVGANGAVILTSVTGAMRSLEVPADVINQKLVLDNVLVLGTVNAKSDDFRQGIVDLSDAERRWPGFLGALITRRVPLADAARALPHDASQIKTVVEIAA